MSLATRPDHAIAALRRRRRRDHEVPTGLDAVLLAGAKHWRAALHKTDQGPHTTAFATEAF